MRLQLVWMAVLALTLGPHASAQTTGEATESGGLSEYEKKVFINEGDSLPYRLLKPENEVQGKKYPLVIFLHGSGERGNDNKIQLSFGGKMWMNPVNREKHPTYVLFPQCPRDSFGVFSIDASKPFNHDEFMRHPKFSKVGMNLKALIESYIANPQIDSKRIYIMGTSMGSMSTFDMAIRFPELFTAVVPICGSLTGDRLKSLQGKDIKFRIFHGDADPIAPVTDARAAYRKLLELGVDVEYFEYPGVDHGCWYKACIEPTFVDWIFNQRKN